MTAQRSFLLTGAQGFIGRYTVAAILTADPDAFVIGCGRSPVIRSDFTHSITLGSRQAPAPLPIALRDTIEREHSRYRYVQVDITERLAVRNMLDEYDPLVIIHLASGLRDDPSEALIRTNILGTVTLAQAAVAAKRSLAKMIFGSSGSVYGKAPILPINEEYRGDPQDIYAVTKLAAEHAARVVTSAAPFQSAYARIFNVVGPGQEERHVVGKIAAQLTAISRHEQAPILHLGDLRPTRDFVDVRDVAAALVLLALHDRGIGSFNIAGGEETSIETVVQKLLSISGTQGVSIKGDYNRSLDIGRHFADIAKLRALGYSPLVSLDQSLGDVYRYYQWASAASP